MHLNSSPRPVHEPSAAVDDAAHVVHDSYVVDDEPNVPTDTVGDDRDGIVPCASSSGGLDLQLLLDRNRRLAGDNVSAQRDLAEQYAPIKVLEAELVAEQAKRTNEAAVPPASSVSAVPTRASSRTELDLLL